MKTELFINDIPTRLAHDAYRGTSFSPERRAESTRQEYAEQMVNDWASLAALAEKNKTTDLLGEEFARYREGYASRYRAYLASSSRCVSTMIAGPSNFPARQMNKRADTAHKRLGEVLEFRERALKAIRKVLCPMSGPIMAGDSDAVQRLKADIEKAEASQAQMKAINAAHKAFLKDPASLDTSILPEEIKVTIRNYVPEYSWEPHPIPPFRFTNLGANIRRMKARLEQIEKAKARPDEVIEGTNEIRYEDSPGDNRVRLFYPGKPSGEIRSVLKSSGFRWSPTLGCWQAYRNIRSVTTAREQAGINEEKAT